jgi:hypothetical protein
MIQTAQTAALAALLLVLPLGGCGGEAAGEAPTGSGLVVRPDLDPTVGPGPELPFDRPNFFSFGKVREGQVVTHVFHLENTDPGPVTVKRIVPSCGCTTPLLSYTDADGNVVRGDPMMEGVESILTIPAGVIAELEVRIDTDDVTTKNLDKTLPINITTDSPNGYYLTLETHIYVRRPFNLVPNGINFGRVPLSGEKTGSMDIVPTGEEDVRITGIESLPDGVTAELTHETVVGKDKWTLTATVHPPHERGRWTANAILATEDVFGAPAAPLVVGLQADRVPDLVTSPTRLVFAARGPDSESVVRLTSLLPGHRIGITGAALPAEHGQLLELTYEPEEPDGSGKSPSWLVTLRARDGASVVELLRGEVALTLDDPQHPEVRVAYVVHPATR